MYALLFIFHFRFFSSADGMIVLYDVRDQGSFDSAQILLKDFQQKGKVADCFLGTLCFNFPQEICLYLHSLTLKTNKLFTLFYLK